MRINSELLDLAVDKQFALAGMTTDEDLGNDVLASTAMDESDDALTYARKMVGQTMTSINPHISRAAWNRETHEFTRKANNSPIGLAKKPRPFAVIVSFF